VQAQKTTDAIQEYFPANARAPRFRVGISRRRTVASAAHACMRADALWRTAIAIIGVVKGVGTKFFTNFNTISTSLR
jgi:hypothetical protein